VFRPAPIVLERGPLDAGFNTSGTPAPTRGILSPRVLICVLLGQDETPNLIYSGLIGRRIRAQALLQLGMPMCLVCLIGESDPFVAHLLQRFAEAMGLRAQWTTASQDLVELARRRRPAVIIFEPELPGRLRGWEAAKLLKSDLQTRDIPLISCSWQTEADVRALLGDVCGHLQKPDLRFREFVALLHAAGVSTGDRSTPA
jgi:hypothetical protein